MPTSATSNAVFSSTENAGKSSKRKPTPASFFPVFTMYSLHNAADDMIQDMDLGDHYQARIENDIVTVFARINPQKQVVLRVSRQENRVRVELVRHSQIAPLFAQLILESLAVQLDPNYFM